MGFPAWVELRIPDARRRETGEAHIGGVIPAYMVSKFAEAEWAAAFADDPTGEAGKLVPVRVEEFDPSGLLKAPVYVDLVELEADEAKAALLGR